MLSKENLVAATQGEKARTRSYPVFDMISVTRGLLQLFVD
jgi:hypothetical protein